MDRRTWLIRTGSAILGVACAPLERLADWHAAQVAPQHPPIFRFYKQTLFVNSAAGSRGGPGTSWETAFASIHDAIGAITEDGTTVLIAPSHTETMSGPIVVSEHGVRMIGISDGSTRPKFIMREKE